MQVVSVRSRKYERLVCIQRDNGSRILMYHKAAPRKSLYMIEIWPLHPLESWPWILVLRLAARIRGNLQQTHILLREIWAYFASALFQKRKTRLLLNCNLWLLTEKGKYCARGWFFSYHFLFVSKVGRAERQRNLLIFSSVRRKDFSKVKLNSWATWPPHKLMKLSDAAIAAYLCQELLNSRCALVSWMTFGLEQGKHLLSIYY